MAGAHKLTLTADAVVYERSAHKNELVRNYVATDQYARRMRAPPSLGPTPHPHPRPRPPRRPRSQVRAPLPASVQQTRTYLRGISVTFTFRHFTCDEGLAPRTRRGRVPAAGRLTLFLAPWCRCWRGWSCCQKRTWRSRRSFSTTSRSTAATSHPPERRRTQGRRRHQDGRPRAPARTRAETSRPYHSGARPYLHAHPPRSSRWSSAARPRTPAFARACNDAAGPHAPRVSSSSLAFSSWLFAVCNRRQGSPRHPHPHPHPRPHRSRPHPHRHPHPRPRPGKMTGVPQVAIAPPATRCAAGSANPHPHPPLTPHPTLPLPHPGDGALGRQDGRRAAGQTHIGPPPTRCPSRRTTSSPTASGRWRHHDGHHERRSPRQTRTVTAPSPNRLGVDGATTMDIMKDGAQINPNLPKLASLALALALTHTLPGRRPPLLS